MVILNAQPPGRKRACEPPLPPLAASRFHPFGFSAVRKQLWFNIGRIRNVAGGLRSRRLGGVVDEAAVLSDLRLRARPREGRLPGLRAADLLARRYPTMKIPGTALASEEVHCAFPTSKFECRAERKRSADPRFEQWILPIGIDEQSIAFVGQVLRFERQADLIR